ncbi:hypothetical protein [Candidatus Tisiphia endosymbiont of Hybos culiciformis]|uniref:hypothetical protein n=1 Tax=Candidatus Tisiphia endosymbiont of Hybos culiciformis TaxID=3139331 RepID=UPI003CCB4AB9
MNQTKGSILNGKLGSKLQGRMEFTGVVILIVSICLASNDVFADKVIDTYQHVNGNAFSLITEYIG